MNELDKLIHEALDEEEREVLRRIGDEPGFFSQAFGVFSGPTGWVNVVLMVVQGLLFVAAVWAAWHFFDAGDPVTQLRWGLPASVMLILAMMLKLALVPRIETNMIMRELKRIELQIAHKKA